MFFKDEEEFEEYQERQCWSNRISNCDNIRLIYSYMLKGNGKIWCKYDEGTNSWAISISHYLLPDDENPICSILMLRGMV